MPKKLILKLAANAKPHIYIDDIKKLMNGDLYLHPQMRAMLLMIKKTRVPFVRLASIKEIILYPEKSMHFERVIEPQLTGYFRIEWSEEERIKYAKDKVEWIANILMNYKKMGYEFNPAEDYPIEKAEELVKLTEVKKK
jgi:hypothetical protein